MNNAEDLKYIWICPKCGKQYITIKPIPMNYLHYVCPSCYYNKEINTGTQVFQCAPVVDDKEVLCD